MSDLGNLPNPINAGIPRKKNRPAEKHADIEELFAAEDRRIAIWGRPYDGPVKNTKLKKRGDH